MKPVTSPRPTHWNHLTYATPNCCMSYITNTNTLTRLTGFNSLQNSLPRATSSFLRPANPPFQPSTQPAHPDRCAKHLSSPKPAHAPPPRSPHRSSTATPHTHTHTHITHLVDPQVILHSGDRHNRSRMPCRRVHQCCDSRGASGLNGFSRCHPNRKEIKTKTIRRSL